MGRGGLPRGPVQLVLLLVALLLLSIAGTHAAVTLRSGKTVGQPQPQQQQAVVPPQPQPQLQAAGGGLLHDAAVFLGHHVFGMVGLGATAGTAYRFGPGAVEWVASRDCYQAGAAAAAAATGSTPTYVTQWERMFWRVAGGLEGCAVWLWEEVRRDPKRILPRPVNPHASELADLPVLDHNLPPTLLAIAVFLASARLKLKPRGGGPSGRTVLWGFAASAILGGLVDAARSSAFFRRLEDTCVAWYGTPTELEWSLYTLLRAALVLIDTLAHFAFFVTVGFALYAAGSYLLHKLKREEAWAEAQEPPGSPTPPPSPKRKAIPIPEAGARAGGGGGGPGEEGKRSEDDEGARTKGGSVRHTPQRSTTTTTTAMMVLTPATPMPMPGPPSVTKKRRTPMTKEGGAIKVIQLGGGVVKWYFSGDSPDRIVGLPPAPEDEEEEEGVQQEGVQEEKE